jgi:multiple sugar transport system substrate-binding protein
MSSYQVSRRNLLKSMGVASVGAFLAACAPAPVGVPSSDTEAGAAPVAATPTTLNALFPSAVLADEYYQALSDRFKEATGITVEFSLLPFERLMDRELTLSAAQSDDVDIFATHYAQIGRFAEALAPLNDFAERDAISGEAYVQGSFDAFTINNNLLAIPTTFDLRALYYRTDLFGAAGIEAPPATRDDLLEVAQALNNPPELYGYLTVGKGDPALREFSDLLWENGGDFLEGGLEPSPPAWNSEEGVAALQWWYDLIHTHEVAPPGTPGYGWEELSQLWTAGQAAMSKQWGPAASQDPSVSTIVGNFSIAPLPSHITNRTTAVCHGRGINIYTQYVDASWEFVKFATSQEELLNLFEALGSRPAHLEALDQAAQNASEIDSLNLEASLAGAANGYTWPLFPEFSEVQPILWAEIEKALSGQKSPQEALDFAADEAVKIFERAGLI